MSKKSYDQRLKERWKQKQKRDNIRFVYNFYAAYGKRAKRDE